MPEEEQRQGGRWGKSGYGRVRFRKQPFPALPTSLRKPPRSPRTAPPVAAGDQCPVRAGAGHPAAGCRDPHGPRRTLPAPAPARCQSSLRRLSNIRGPPDSSPARPALHGSLPAALLHVSGRREPRCRSVDASRLSDPLADLFGVEIRSVQASFSRINSAAGKDLFSVDSDLPEGLDRDGPYVRATSFMPHGGSGRKSGARGDLPPAGPGLQPSDRRDPKFSDCSDFQPFGRPSNLRKNRALLPK